ncbi:hypothetical protein C8J56DRAFT_878135 [Mycena floridula]|nr:hypothetical protein C8J56DRAFT_878135 [Mycena floridula]
MGDMGVSLKSNSIGTVSGDVSSHNTIHYHHPPDILPRSRGYMPAPNSNFFGRGDEIAEIVKILTAEPASRQSRRAWVAILGSGGQGKTALALKVMAHPAMKSCYSKKNSLWGPCEEASSTALLIHVLVTSLAIRKDRDNTIDDILDELQATSDPTILLLDNFETPWNAPGARGAVAQILRDIAQLPHIALLITMRATIAPCEEIEWTEMRIRPLDPKASHDLYISIDKKAQKDDRLPELLDMLAHMALAVKLMASIGRNNGQTVEELILTYRTTGTAMLGSRSGSDPQTSVSASIRMSLESSLVRDELNAYVLLNIIAMLPAGTTLKMVETWWAPALENRNGALTALLETSLIEQQDRTYFVLPVIRTYILDPSRFPDDICNSVIDAACNFLQKHSSVTPGELLFKDDLKARSLEEINLQAVLLRSKTASPAIIRALIILARHQYRTRLRTEVIEHAVLLARQGSDQKLIGDTLRYYGEILFRLNRMDEAVDQYKLAQKSYLAVSKKELAGRLSLEIADATARIDPSTDDISLMEQVRKDFESSDDAKVSDWAFCLRLLGRAHLRHKNYSDAIEHLTHA